MSGIGRNTMQKLVDWGKLPVLKVGRKMIIRRDALENFMTVNQGEKPAQSGRRPGGALKDGHSRKKASPFESEIYPSHKSGDLFKGYFAPAEGPYRLCRLPASHSIQRKMLPEEKVEIVTLLKRSGNVCMIGDGVNDAPALKTADVYDRKYQ